MWSSSWPISNFLPRIPSLCGLSHQHPKEEHFRLTINPLAHDRYERHNSQSSAYTLPCLVHRFEGHIRPTGRPFQGSPSRSFEADHELQQSKRIEWADLDLRQTWADESFMRSHIRASGMNSPSRNEAATVIRLPCLLRRAGVMGLETRTSLGTPLLGS